MHHLQGLAETGILEALFLFNQKIRISVFFEKNKLIFHEKQKKKITDYEKKKSKILCVVW